MDEIISEKSIINWSTFLITDIHKSLNYWNWIPICTYQCISRKRCIQIRKVHQKIFGPNIVITYFMSINCLCWHAAGKWLECNVLDTGYIMAKWLQYWWILMGFSTFKGLQYVQMGAPTDVNALILILVVNFVWKLPLANRKSSTRFRANGDPRMWT